MAGLRAKVFKQDELNMFLFVCCLIITSAEELTIEDILKASCPVNRPYKCLPYAACCGADEFCYNGACESCFPRTSEHDLLTWCRTVGLHDVSKMTDVTCRLACQARFTVEELADDQSSQESNNDDKWYHRFMAMCLVAIVLLCSTTTFVSLLCYTICIRRRHRQHSLSKGLRTRFNRRQSQDLNDDGTERYTELALQAIVTENNPSDQATNGAYFNSLSENATPKS